MKNYAKETNTKLKKSIVNKKTSKNYYSKEIVDTLVPDAIPPLEEGVNITDSNYEDDMYSNDQLEKHKKSNMNVYTVDGIPSRWHHNKLRSTWHFDPKGDAQEKTFTVMCKFKGNWEAGIQRAIDKCKEHTIGNYRPRNMSQQDKDLHDGEMMDIKRASGKDDVSCMYHYQIAGLKTGKDTHPDCAVFFRMLESVGMYDVHQSRIHIQRLGEVTPFHIDQQMRYARPHWRDRWVAAGADKNPLMLRRILISLTPWDYGHVWQFGNTYYQGYDAGECVVYDWCNMPHAASNMGYTPRITLQATGFINDKFTKLMETGSKEHIINV